MNFEDIIKDDKLRIARNYGFGKKKYGFCRSSIGIRPLVIQSYIAAARKVLFVIFWDTEGVVHKEFLNQGQTMNSEQLY